MKRDCGKRENVPWKKNNPEEGTAGERGKNR
jgi:hypothetical protein